MTKKKLPPASELQALFDPRLVGAACVGHHDLFDEHLEDECVADRLTRHSQAVAICRRCPVIAACREVALEHLDHISGIWAGQPTIDLTARRTA
ncbi:UNVERIFIED_ORG: transcription factor WhiB [Nocardia globerula]|uniref:Transcription factor WhiB n=2 Tax=Nocardiaceae TaxID=85025 RepID=A0A652YYN8_NOCGL|nr:hypothetical protein [Nocardia globerula]PVX64967.1 transcription factor WhiB [Rhodococcus globerulus]